MRGGGSSQRVMGLEGVKVTLQNKAMFTHPTQSLVTHPTSMAHVWMVGLLLLSAASAREARLTVPLNQVTPEAFEARSPGTFVFESARGFSPASGLIETRQGKGMVQPIPHALRQSINSAMLAQIPVYPLLCTLHCTWHCP